MRKYLLLTIITLSVISTIKITSDNIVIKTNKPENDTSYISQDQSPYYIIKDSNNNIAVYKYPENEEIILLNEPLVSELPVVDRRMLEQGIRAEQITDVQKILEDYDY